MKSSKVVILSATAAHVLAWAAFLWLAFWPYSYRGVTATPVGPDGTGGQDTHLSASFIEVNGLWVVIPLLAPVALTALALIVALIGSRGRAWNKIVLWVFAVILLAFCGVGMFSIGLLYLPAALALLISAIAFSLRPAEREPNPVE